MYFFLFSSSHGCLQWFFQLKMSHSCGNDSGFQNYTDAGIDKMYLQVDECSKSCEMFVDLWDVIHVMRHSPQFQRRVWRVLLFVGPWRAWNQITLQYINTTEPAYIQCLYYYWDGWLFVGIPSWYLTKPPRPTQPGHPSVGRWNEYSVLAIVTAIAREENGEYQRKCSLTQWYDRRSKRKGLGNCRSGTFLGQMPFNQSINQSKNQRFLTLLEQQ